MKYIKSLIFSSLLIVSSCSSNKIPYSRQEFLKQNDEILQNADVSAESKALTCEKPTISKKETFFSGASKYGNNEGS